MSEYSTLFDLLDNDINSLENLPIDSLTDVLELVQSKCIDEIESPVELLQTAFSYISHHVKLMQETPRILSFDEQIKQEKLTHIQTLRAEKMFKEADSLEKELEQQSNAELADKRIYQRQLKSMQKQLGVNQLNIQSWVQSVASSDVTNLSVSELLDLTWQEFIQLSNALTVQNNLLRAHEEDSKHKAQREQQRQQQMSMVNGGRY